MVVAGYRIPLACVGIQGCDCRTEAGCIAVDVVAADGNAAAAAVDTEQEVEQDSRKESVRRKVRADEELGCKKELEGQCRTTIVDKCSAPDGRWCRTMKVEWARKVSSLPGGRTIELHTTAGNCYFFLQSRANMKRKRKRKPRM